MLAALPVRGITGLLELTAAEFRRLMTPYSDEPDVLLAEARAYIMFVLPGAIILARQRPYRGRVSAQGKGPLVTVVAPDNARQPCIRILNKVDFVGLVAGQWKEPAATFELIKGGGWAYSGDIVALGGRLEELDKGDYAAVADALIVAREEDDEQARREEIAESTANWRREHQTAVALRMQQGALAMMRREAFEREMRDRNQRDHLVTGAVMILGGILGARRG